VWRTAKYLVRGDDELRRLATIAHEVCRHTEGSLDMYGSTFFVERVLSCVCKALTALSYYLATAILFLCAHLVKPVSMQHKLVSRKACMCVVVYSAVAPASVQALCLLM
jgi:hypothetical protein